MEQFEIKVDKNIVLRLHKMDIAQKLFDFIDKNRTYLREWLPWLDMNTELEDTKKFILECQENYKNGKSLNLGIYFKGELLGSVGFNSINKLNKSAEIGYMLGKNSNGKGIMTKSCKAIIDYGFNVLNLNRIVIKAAVKNTKSRAIPERLGFEQEGILQQAEFLYNHYVDIVVYGMLKENWK